MFYQTVSLLQKTTLKALIDKKVIEFLSFQYFQIKNVVPITFNEYRLNAEKHYPYCF